jgi:transcriptional regulator with XRE-family HTH domain
MNETPELMRAFGEVVEEHRKKLGLSQERLALAAGLDRTFVWKVEHGKRNPSLESLFRVAAALRTEPDELVREVKNRVQG